MTQTSRDGTQTDHVTLSQRPDQWNVLALILTGSFLALV